jgi:hypothetical protein
MVGKHHLGETRFAIALVEPVSAGHVSHTMCSFVSSPWVDCRVLSS